MIKKFKIFESLSDITVNSDISVNDVAWLFFLYYIYDGSLNIKSWEKDNRMGVNCKEALEKFDCVDITDGYFKSTDNCKKIINEYFGASTIEEALNRRNEYRKYDNASYQISKLPYELFVFHNHPSIGKSFDKISDIIVDHFNSQIASTRILDKLLSIKNIDKWNYKTAFNMFDGNIPEKIVIYRGIKNVYDVDRKTEYSCWTTSLKEAERFSKYVFTGGKQFEPTYSKTQNVLVSEVSFDDIAIFIGDDESEVIMKGTVNIDKIIN